MLGLPEGEIAAALPGIEAFAEIGHYIDEPVRTYSSGMQVRLAFSVATALRPDVLIVDEALAVGDVDSAALRAIYGASGYCAVRNPLELPTRLLGLLERLVQ